MLSGVLPLWSPTLRAGLSCHTHRWMSHPPPWRGQTDTSTLTRFLEYTRGKREAPHAVDTCASSCLPPSAARRMHIDDTGTLTRARASGVHRPSQPGGSRRDGLEAGDTAAGRRAWRPRCLPGRGDVQVPQSPLRASPGLVAGGLAAAGPRLSLLPRSRSGLPLRAGLRTSARVAPPTPTPELLSSRRLLSARLP